MPLEPGTTLAHYEILGTLGTGGMGEVYRALDSNLGRRVALKVLPASLAGDPTRIDRFKREARAVAALNHPNIVTVFSVEEFDGMHFLTMELVEGETLDRQVPLTGLPAARLLDLAWVLADALIAAHKGGIVHRDLKPTNVMISQDGRVKVLDFGLAKRLDEPAPGSEAKTMVHTSEGLVLGTVPYMSPEQIEGKPLDHRSDIFSLGVMLHESATGSRPFQGDSPAAIFSSILRDAAPAIGRRRPDLPPEFARVIGRCLEKDRDRRIQTAMDVRDALDAIRHEGNSGRTFRAAPARSDAPESDDVAEANRLTDEGIGCLRFGAAGGASARSHLNQAEIYLKRALSMVPTHARALCHYGQWHFVMVNLGFIPHDEGNGRGRELVFAALAADDRLADVHYALSKIYLFQDDDYRAAGRHVDRAVALNPVEAEGLRIQSIVRKLEGRLDEAVASAQAAVALSPELAALWNALGDVLLAAGRPAEAVEALRGAISRHSGYLPALERMELALVRLGQFDEAINFRAARLRGTGQSERAALLTEEARNLGAADARRRDLARELERLLAEAAQRHPFTDHRSRTLADRIIVAYTDVGDWTNAMSWIERAYAHRPGRLRRLLMDLPIDRRGLASDPRYARLLLVAGLEELL